MLGDFDLAVFLHELFQRMGINTSLSFLLTSLILVILVALLSWLSYILARFIINKVVYRVVKRTRFKWDDIFFQKKVFTSLSHFAPAIVIWLMAGWALDPYEGWLTFIQKLTYVYMVLAGTIFFYSFIDAWYAIYLNLPISKHRHLKGFVQLAKIFLAIVAILIIISAVFEREMSSILTGIGAMAAVILLIFRDTILGLVASVQLSANNMVNVGDWISMPSRGTDGDVIDITLNTVKVQNFDKTIITIPTYALVQESFQNWSGMERSGGRRIKRAIHIDISSIGFLSPDDIRMLKKIQLLSDYIELKEKELLDFNNKHGVDDSVLVNGRRMTNIGTFRAYVEAYLKQHPKIHNDMTFLVRQLPPGEYGLPLEIYVFSNDQEWANYEAIQADIFDHLLSAVKEFGLKVFQNPTGDDFRTITGKNQ